MATLIPDNIDFSAYLDDTDAQHKVRPASAFADDVVSFYHSPTGPVGDRMPWQKTHDLIRFRPGEVTLWGGMNGHGKSLVLGQICLSLAVQRRRVCIASMEMRPAMTLARICRQSFGANQPDSCNECDCITVGHTCSGQVPGAPDGYRPNIREPRRCIAFAPRFGTMDDRPGRQLWPELVKPFLVEMPAPAKAIEAAKDLLADLLKDGPRDAGEILATAEGASIPKRTMQAAAERLGVSKVKAEFTGGWTWTLAKTKSSTV